MPQKPKKQAFSLQGFDLNHYRQTEGYVQAVDALYNQAVQEFAQMASQTKIDPDKLFSFSDYPQTKVRAQKIITELAQKLQAVIIKGSREQWLYACKKNDQFLNYIMNTAKIPEARMKKFQDRNLDALDAFQNRKIAGLDLSQRIWNYAGQMKTQMELGIDIAIGEGKSAQGLSKDLRQYLVDPDKLFHRVRNKHGQLVLSKNAKAFHPGQGKYRSSYKNAMRLTRSEINMAYREADQIRWRQLDFVVGYEIKLSNNHTLNGKPFVDICDHLAGKYPKSFIWKGWHPQCRCYVVPILMNREEFNTDELNELKAALRGTEYKKFEASNTVYDVPQAFKDWTAANLEKSKNWISQPYFIRDNFNGGTIAGGLKIAAKPQMAPKKPVKTQAQKEAIQAKWNTHQLTKKYQAELDGIATLYNDVPAIKALYNKINSEIAKGTDQNVVASMVEKINHKTKVKDAWEARKVANKAKALIYKTTKMATNLVEKAEAIGMTGKELDEVKSLLAKKGVTNAELNKAYGKLNQVFKNAKAPIDPLSKAELLKKYTSQEVDGLLTNVNAKITSISKNDLEQQAKDLKFEANWVAQHKKYKTWPEAEQLYLNKLKEVETLLKFKQAKASVQQLEFTVNQLKNSKITAEYNEILDAVSSGSLSPTAPKVLKLIEKIQKEQQKHISKSLISKSQVEKYCDKNRNDKFIGENFSDFDTVQKQWISDQGSVWAMASKEVKEAMRGYTNGTYSRINLSQYRDFIMTKEGKLIESFIEKCVLTKDTVLRRGTDMSEVRTIFGDLFANDLVSRKIDSLIGMRGVNESFISTSFSEVGGFSGTVEFVFFAPKGTQAAYAKPYAVHDSGTGSWNGVDLLSNYYAHAENEIVVNNGYELRVTKVEYNTGKKGANYRIYVDLLTRDKRRAK